MTSVESLFLSYTAAAPESCIRLTASGSRRVYYRLALGDRTLIGVQGTDPDENRAFITLAGHFRVLGFNVPEVLSVSDDGMTYLQEDLGDVILYDRLSTARETGEYTEEDRKLLCSVMAALAELQFGALEGLDFSVCYPSPSFGARMVDFDLNYFKYDYLKLTEVEFNEELLQDDFDRLKEDLLAEPCDAFMYRDFQARNVMLRDDEPWFIDFQGGRKGPACYDVASFVWQARARYPEDLKRRLADAYFEAAGRWKEWDRAAFDSSLRLFVLFRTLQVLGAYGFRGRIEKKAHFLESIPYALANLRELLEQPFERYPYLSGVLRRLVDSGPSVTAEDGSLEVRIYSFSYRKGIPEDFTGNGGGYVFDCRSVHNPGKYERYRHSTGLDDDVMSFLEEDGEILNFLGHVYALVDAHVERFLSRGFTHLQISFGCTGGQHRSAYCAQHLAERLSRRPGVRVHLIHRELGIDKLL